MKLTYVLGVLGDHDASRNVGEEAATREIAKLSPGKLRRGDNRLVLRELHWNNGFCSRSIIVEMEEYAGQWQMPEVGGSEA